MMPYINPNYFNQPQFQQPMYQMPQQNTMQMPQQQNQFDGIGKKVENIEMVKIIDIPMDGQTYYFPKADGTEIYAKQWLPNGTTKVISYLPQIEQEDAKPNNLPFDALESKFNALNDAVDALQDNLNKLSSDLNKISKQTRAKKVETDES